MKARLRLFALLALLTFSAGNVIAETTQWRPGKIALESEKDVAETRGGDEELPIDAEITVDALIIKTYAPLGNATVRITSATRGVVHNESVSFMSPREYSVYLGNYAAGDYTVQMIFTYGITLEADFTLE